MSVVVGSETLFSEIDGLAALWEESLGVQAIRVAVLDGPVDENHVCFRGASLTRLTTLVSDAAGSGPMSAHGTHVASEIFGQPLGPVPGIAPGCHGLLLPVFPDNPGGRLPQLDLARAIEQAVENGAHVINISAGERSPTSEADFLLQRAIQRCEDAGVLITAAAGNDGCDCLHVPAAVASVLAVGAINKIGRPLAFSNWGEAYQYKGVLAPGENIRGAVPGGGTALRTGTSFAAPIVAGVAALLLSIQHQRGKKPDPRAVREAIIASARPCTVSTESERRQCLTGILNIPGAYAIITRTMEGAIRMTDPELITVGSTVEASASKQTGENLAGETAMPSEKLASVGQKLSVAGKQLAAAAIGPAGPGMPQLLAQESNSVPASSDLASIGFHNTTNCGCNGGRKSYIFAIGALGYDFGTEARRNSFRQLMPAVNDRPANPYATEQLISYLTANPAESSKLVWTFNLELTPIYAIEAELPYAREIYEILRAALNGQIQTPDSDDYISRVSLSGVLTNKTTKLYSGQIVPIVIVQSRGLWAWNVKTLVEAVVARFEPRMHDRIRVNLDNFLNRVYYELRNLGQTSPDRALNFSATNAFQASEALSRALHPRELVPEASSLHAGRYLRFQEPVLSDGL